MTAAPFLSSSWYRVARRRPKLRDHTSVHRHRYRGSVWYVVQDHATGRVHRLSPAGYMIVAAMDGVRTVDQLWQEAGSHLAEDAPSQSDVIQLLAELNAADLLQTEVTPDSSALVERAARAGRSGWLGNVLYPLALRIPFWHPDRFFERTRPLAKWLFGSAGCRSVAARGAAGVAAGGTALARTRRRRLRPHPCCQQHSATRAGLSRAQGHA